MGSKSYEAPQCEIFSNLLLLHPFNMYSCVSFEFQIDTDFSDNLKSMHYF
jgi:hypothetical protein